MQSNQSGNYPFRQEVTGLQIGTETTIRNILTEEYNGRAERTNRT